MHWMHRCNKVTEKCHIIRKYTNSNIERYRSFDTYKCAKKFQARSLIVYLLDIDLLTVACQWVSRLYFHVVIWNANALNCSSWEMKLNTRWLSARSLRSLEHIISECFWKDNAWQMWLLLFGFDNSIVETLISQAWKSVYILKSSIVSHVLIKMNTFYNL